MALCDVSVSPVFSSQRLRIVSTPYTRIFLPEKEGWSQAWSARVTGPSPFGVWGERLPSSGGRRKAKPSVAAPPSLRMPRHVSVRNSRVLLAYQHQDSYEAIVVEPQRLRKRHLAYDARLLYVEA